MAFSTTRGAAEYVSQGPMGVGGIYTTKRKYSLSDLIVYQDRVYAKLDWILRQDLRTITVSDPEPKTLTKREAPVSFDITAADETTVNTYDTVHLADADAKFLQAGDILMNQSIFCDGDGSNYSTTKFTYPPETMIVKSVVLSEHSSGTAHVYVSRGNGNDPSSPTQQTTSHKLVKIGNALADGGDAPNAIHYEPASVQNYCQLFSKTWAETETESNTDVYGKETMAEKATRKRMEFFRETEFALFFGRKAKRTTGGQTQWLTGGIVEFIPDASGALDGETRLIDFGGAFDLDTWREKMEIVFRYGNPRAEKWAFCGGKFFTVLYNNLEKFIRYNDTLSKRYEISVNTLETGHGELHLTRHSLFTEITNTNMEYGYDCVIIDLDYVDLMIMQGMDVQVKTDVQDADEHSRKNEIYAQLGLHRLHPTAHAYIYGITG